MVGKEYEQGGIIKHGAMMINAVSNSRSRTSRDHGRVLRCRQLRHERARLRPRFLFTWPSAKSAVMGPAQLAGVLEIVARQSAESRGDVFDAEGIQGIKGDGGAQIEEQSLPFFLSGMLYDDGVIDPATPGRSSASACPSSTPSRSSAPTASASSGCEQLINRLLVANRAEIASRVFRTCRKLGIETVAVHSDADAALPFVRGRPRRAPARQRTGGDLSADRPVSTRPACTGADAIHPGYGFLSENADFARLPSVDAGPDLDRPTPGSIDAMGSKIGAKGS